MRMNDAYRTLKTGAHVTAAEEAFTSFRGALSVYERSWFWSIGLLRPSRALAYLARNTLYKWVAAVGLLVEECARLKVENETLKQNAADAKRVRQRYDRLRRDIHGGFVGPASGDDMFGQTAADFVEKRWMVREGIEERATQIVFSQVKSNYKCCVWIEDNMEGQLVQRPESLCRNLSFESAMALVQKLYDDETYGRRAQKEHAL